AKYVRLAEEHDDLGWTNFIEGRISCKFFEIQLQFYVKKRLRKSAGKWASGLIERLIGLIHSQWLYRKLSNPLRVTLWIDLLPEDSNLMEVDFNQLAKANSNVRRNWASICCRCGKDSVAKPALRRPTDGFELGLGRDPSGNFHPLTCPAAATVDGDPQPMNSHVNHHQPSSQASAASGFYVGCLRERGDKANDLQTTLDGMRKGVENDDGVEHDVGGGRGPEFEFVD
ncbi:hypothetical protein THAOC_16900, partial [Thalassiosira oceanica]